METKECAAPRCRKSLEGLDCYNVPFCSSYQLKVGPMDRMEQMHQGLWDRGKTELNQRPDIKAQYSRCRPEPGNVTPPSTAAVRLSAVPIKRNIKTATCFAVRINYTDVHWTPRSCGRPMDRLGCLWLMQHHLQRWTPYQAADVHLRQSYLQRELLQRRQLGVGAMQP